MYEKVNRLEKHHWLLWGIFVFMLISEFYFFRRKAFNQIVYFYPSGFDQTSYLTHFYILYDKIQQYGLIAGIKAMPPLATGLLFPLQAIGVFMLVGAARWQALLINFVYFAALQFVCFLLIRHLTKKTYFAVFFLSFFLMINTPFIGTLGNLFDIRMDFLAFCLYGIFVCSVIWSHFFLNRKRTLIAALVASFMIMMRTITCVYVGGVGLSLFFYLCGKKWLCKKDNCTQQRLVNLILFGLVSVALTLPFIWLNRQTLYAYYMVGHVLGDEKFLRAAQAGITDAWSIVQYYPLKLWHYHLGDVAFNSGLILLGFYFLVQLKTRKPPMNDDSQTWQTGFIFLFLASLLPLIALTLDMNKSPIVVSIVVMPVLWLMFWYCLYVDTTRPLSHRLNQYLGYIAYLVFALGFFHQMLVYRPHFKEADRQQFATISRMYMDIGDYASAHHWPEINIGFDRIIDYLTSGGIVAVYYENKGKLLNVYVERSLGGSMYALTYDEALKSVKRTNVLILNLGEYPPETLYPFHRSLLKFKPVLKEYAETHFAKLGDYPFMHSVYRVYVAKK